MDVDLEKARGVIEPILETLGYELVETRFLSENRQWVLKVLVDRPEGGITIGECEQISREIGLPLEIEEIIPVPYSLEVSSPGLDRPLVKEADFVRFAGKTVQIQTDEPIDGRRNYKGNLVGIEGGILKVLIDGAEYRIPQERVKKAHLVY